MKSRNYQTYRRSGGYASVMTVSGESTLFVIICKQSFIADTQIKEHITKMQWSFNIRGL